MGCFKDRLHHPCKIWRLRAVEIPCPAAIRHVSILFDQIHDILYVTQSQIRPAVLQKPFIGKEGIPVVHFLESAFRTWDSISGRQAKQRTVILRIVSDGTVP